MHNLGMHKLGLAAATVLALGLFAAPAHAQRLNTGATGTFGQVRLTSGFTPDPHNVTVNAGGAYDASTISAECSGYINTRPSFTLRYRAGELPLYIGAVSDSDTTLVVRGPDGSWSCNDDSDGLNPLVSWETPRSGRYQVWVGRFGAQNETPPAVLHISEIGGPAAQEATDQGPDFALDPTYGSVDLTAGFQPDPHTRDISAGGGIDASMLGGSCLGWIARAPDYRVNWTAGSGALPLIFSVQSDADTTLVINDAQGNWVCDDDGGNEGLNPSLSFASPASGQYDVWVGTFTEGQLQPSVLHVSEISSQ